MRYLKPAAWCDWQYFGEHDTQWCLISGDFKSQRYYKIKNFYVRQHVSRFIHPGYTISNYNATDNWTNVFMQSDRMMPVVYTNYNQLRNVTDNPVILAVGDIVKVAAMHRVCDTYGPIPYTRIGQDGKLQVAYDSQEDVYKAMIKELTDAVEVLLPNRTNNFAPTADIIYGGQTEKWIKFANSLNRTHHCSCPIHRHSS